MNHDHRPLTAQYAVRARLANRLLTHLGKAYDGLREARRALNALALDELGEPTGDFDATDYADTLAEVEQAMRGVRHADRIGGAYCDDLARKAGRPARHCITIEALSNSLVFTEHEPGEEPVVRGCAVHQPRAEARELAERLGVVYVEPTDPAVLALLDERGPR
ncbi:hypothetical protein [Streptosporangium roseum]|uniref:hypothetical protein n=1 Tax=Streptosporangium roseum TaxID=2001 RepID=UPI0033204777